VGRIRNLYACVIYVIVIGTLIPILIPVLLLANFFEQTDVQPTTALSNHLTRLRTQFDRTIIIFLVALLAYTFRYQVQ
jgi:hypothetical protein